MKALPWLLSIVVLLTIGCTPTSTRGVGAASEAEPPARRGTGIETVLASATTQRGLVEIVETSDGSREIAYRNPPSDRRLRAKRTPSKDQVLDILAAKAPAARRALVIGLGTGKLSSDLVKAGLEVDVLERDPELARLICAHLECRANVVVDDNPEGLLEGRHTNPKLAKSSVYDALIYDDELSTVPHAMHSIDERFAGIALAPDAFRATRSVLTTMYAPTEGDALPWLLLHGERDDGRFDAVEIFSAPNAPFSGHGSRLWPLHDALTIAIGQTGPTKQARIFGYLVTRDDGSLTASLPHDRAGRLVVRLKGKLAHDKLSPLAVRAITSEDERQSSKASASRMIGVGHSATDGRNVVVSPVAVALTGTASFAGLTPVSRSRTGLVDEGYVYDLDVTNVDRVLGSAELEPLHARIARRFDSAAAMVSRGDYAATARELDAVVTELSTFFAEDAPRVAWLDELKSIAHRLEAATKSGLAAECAELAYHTRLNHSPARPGLDPSEIRFRAALKKKLEAETLAAARKNTDARGFSAARCYWHSTRSDPTFPQAAHFELHRRFPDVPMQDP